MLQRVSFGGPGINTEQTDTNKQAWVVDAHGERVELKHPSTHSLIASLRLETDFRKHPSSWQSGLQSSL